ncbi:hypothetical protein [Shimia sediminis]|uniref:hypothetical protein n=1 Tax=Shimia sediminis TaxID=2497945 RepID=UPI000F8D1423|nr:hypothetical protein [Shimia sediminis]
MDFVIGVSWPRSGHHLLVRLLTHYFGPDFKYCQFYGAPPPQLDGIDACCQTVPCKYAGRIHFTKSHDFDLDVPLISNQKYLVQYRKFSASVVSNYELNVRNGNEDSALAFRRFASYEFDRYQDFLRKWIEPPSNKNLLKLDYDQLLDDPEGSLADAVRFFLPGETVSTNRIRTALAEVDGERIEHRNVTRLQAVGVHTRRDVSTFRHYSSDLFELLDRLKLTRNEVNEVYNICMGSDVPEARMLEFQTCESTDFIHRILSPIRQPNSQFS